MLYDNHACDLQYHIDTKMATHYKVVFYIVANMQTQSKASGDKEYPVASQHNTIVIKDAINEEKKFIIVIVFGLFLIILLPDYINYCNYFH